MKSCPLLPIGQLCTLVNGRAFKPTDWTPDGLPIVRIQNLNDPTKPFNHYSGRVEPRFLINSSDILLSWSGTPGTSFGCFVWDRGPAILNQHIFRVHVHEQTIDRDYFVYAVNSKLEEMIALAHGGVGLRHITKGKLESIELPVPTLSRQRDIVAWVNERMARIDEIRSLRSELLTESRALPASTLAAAFADLETQCGSVEIGRLLVDSRYGTSQKCNAAKDGVPVLRIPNVANGVISLADLKYCQFEKGELDQVRLREGDLLIVRTNGSPDLVGRCAIFEEQAQTFAFASYLIRLRVNPSVADPHFIALFLNSTLGRDAIASIRRTSAGQYNVNSENLRAISVPRVPLAEQQRIATQLREQLAVARSIVEEQDSRADDAKQLRAAILRKAFSVGL